MAARDGPDGLFALAAATVRESAESLTPNVPKALLHAALQGGPLPNSLLYQAVRRNRAEQAITRPRAALIKMVLLSQQTPSTSEDTMTELDKENQDPAYRCGRLLAVLERIQQLAIPGGVPPSPIVSTAPFHPPRRPWSGCCCGRAKPTWPSSERRSRAGRALQGKLEEIQAPVSPSLGLSLWSNRDCSDWGTTTSGRKPADAIARKQQQDDAKNGDVPE